MPRRFDLAFMRPPAPQAAADAALLARVRAWAEAGAFAEPPQPLAVATLAAHPGLDGVAGALDGSHALAALGRWRGIAWRVQLLLREQLAGRPPRRADPWDCGWWRGGPAGLAAAAAFRPRRHTLLLVPADAAAEVPALLAALQPASASYRCALRVLVVGGALRAPVVGSAPGAGLPTLD